MINILKLDLKSLLHKAEYFSIIYLALPYLLFFYGWFRIEYSLPLIALFIYGIFKIVTNIKENQLEEELNNQKSLYLYQFIFFAVIVGIWLYFAGIGGFFYQNGDYFKHNGIFYDLSRFSWPIEYTINRETLIKIPLVYYVAYYLPSSLVIYFLGIEIGEYFIFIWTFVGIMLGFLLFINNLKKINSIFIVLFIFFSGLDYLGYYILNQKIPGVGEHIEWWAQIWQYPSNMTSLFWVPQHFIPALILGSLVFNYFYHEKKQEYLPSVSVLAVLWSPFVSIGLFPFIVALIIRQFKNKFLNLFSSVNLIFLLVFFSLLIYFSSGWYKHPSGFIFNLVQLNWSAVFLYLLFIIFEVYIYALILVNQFKNQQRNLFILLLVFLTFLPLYKFGYYNDLVMRGSLPALILLQIFIFRSLDFSHQKIRTSILVILIIISSLTGIQELQRGIISSRYRMGYSGLLNMSPIFTVQYLGKTNWFWKNIAKSGNNLAEPLPIELTKFLEQAGYFKLSE